MRNTKLKFLLLLMTMALLSPALFADQVSLKNGDRLTTTIVKSDAKTLVLKTEAAGDVTFQWSAIDTIISTQPPRVGLAGGQMVVGPIATTDGHPGHGTDRRRFPRFATRIWHPEIVCAWRSSKTSE